MGRTIEELKQENGVRSMLLLEDGIPMYYPTLYGSLELRHVSTYRQRNILYSIEVLLNWCQCEGTDLEARFRRGEHLSELEILRLVDFCSWTAEVQRKLMSGVKLLPNSYEEVSKDTATQRIHAIREYMNFLYLRLASRKDKSKIAESVSETIKSYKPKIRKHAKNKPVEISDEQIDILTEKLLPDHPENPWQDTAVRVRNLLVISILYETGIRRGELAGLYVNDVQRGKISIFRRHNNPLDTRKQEPHSKTGERTIPIPDDLASLIDDYVMNHRGSIKKAKKHPYLFVSHKRNIGDPLSLGMINEIFKVARSAFPDLKNISPHKMRHHMNYRISKMLDESYESETPGEKALADQQVRPYLMGWKSDSDQQVLYNARYYREEAGKKLVERAEKLNKEK